MTKNQTEWLKNAVFSALILTGMLAFIYACGDDLHGTMSLTEIFGGKILAIIVLCAVWKATRWCYRHGFSPLWIYIIKGAKA